MPMKITVYCLKPYSMGYISGTDCVLPISILLGAVSCESSQKSPKLQKTHNALVQGHPIYHQSKGQLPINGY